MVSNEGGTVATSPTLSQTTGRTTINSILPMIIALTAISPESNMLNEFDCDKQYYEMLRKKKKRLEKMDRLNSNKW